MMKKASSLLLTIALGTFLSCGDSFINFPALGDDDDQSTAWEEGNGPEGGRGPEQGTPPTPTSTPTPTPTPSPTPSPTPGDVGDAPILTIPHLVSSAGSAVVPITVEQFDEIASYDLRLLYDPEIMTATSVSGGPGVSEMLLFSYLEEPGEIAIAWVTDPAGLSLADDAVFLTITFDKVQDGLSQIQWDGSNPNDLQPYIYDGQAIPLNDEPHENFYFPGSLEFD